MLAERAARIVRLHDGLTDEIQRAIAAALADIGVRVLADERCVTRDVESAIVTFLDEPTLDLNVTVRVYDVDNHRTIGHHSVAVSNIITHLEEQ